MKEQGEKAELKFMMQCMNEGKHISIPFGDNQKYDCIVDGESISRVQVKSTSRRDKHNNCDRYHALIARGSGSKLSYSKDEVDFIAVHILPTDCWYIIPIEAVEGRKTINLYPHNDTDGKYEEYLERWDLL